MALAPREEDLEAGFGVEAVSAGERCANFAFGGSSFSGKYMERFHQETVDEARPLLLQNRLENQEEHEGLINLRMKAVKDKNRKVNAKRPPKPPRPPNGPSLDAADLKLIRELSELALEKRMRIERMKDLKKLRACKAAASSNSPNSTFVALIITVLFCLIILFQGMCARSGSVISLQRSPGPVLSPNSEDLISIQVFKDLSPDSDGNGRSSGTEQQLRTNKPKYLHSKASNISLFSKFHRHSSLTSRRSSQFSRNTALLCNVEGGLLKSSSLFPYFMLVAFEGGSLLRALLLLALYPFISLFRSNDIRLKLMVMISFFGLKKDGFRIGTSVLPKFLLEDVGWEGFEVTKKKRFVRKVGVSAMPRVMVETFLKDYLAFDSVIGSELKVCCGYFVGLMYNNTLDMPVDDTHVLIGISSIDSSLDQHLMSNCDEIYFTTETERSCWKQLPTDKYPKPLIFHDGRLAFRPTPIASLAMFMWLPFGILLAFFRVIVGLCMPYYISIPALGFSGLNLRFKSTAQNVSLSQAKGTLYVCNHRTLLDPLYLCFILKKNLTAVTYSLSRMSEILSPIRTVRLTRELNKDSRLMDRYLSQGDMVVCPEGTTCREPYILRFSPLFTEMSEIIVPVAMDCNVSMFYGTTAGGLKCLDPLFFLMNPFPSYTVIFLDQVTGLSYSTSEVRDLEAIGRDSRRFDIANRVQTELGKTLKFECTKLTRKDKYLVLAGNDGLVSPYSRVQFLI